MGASDLNYIIHGKPMEEVKVTLRALLLQTVKPAYLECTPEWQNDPKEGDFLSINFNKGGKGKIVIRVREDAAKNAINVFEDDDKRSLTMMQKIAFPGIKLQINQILTNKLGAQKLPV